MAMHKISKGLRLPLPGEPEQVISAAMPPRFAALLGADYLGMRPRMAVAVGDTVRRGQLLFEDKKTPGVRYTAPAAGTIAAIHRGEQRVLQSVVIKLNDAERNGKPGNDDYISFSSFTGHDPAGLSNEQIKSLLLESGLWAAFRARPFGKIANPSDSPHSIFVTAMDTNPLAASPDVVIQGNEAFFEKGLLCVAKLTSGKTYLCRKPGSAVTAKPYSGVTIEEFDGPHPAGTVGLHIHMLDPVHRGKTVWHINYQDVVSIGKLFTTGKLDVERVIAVGGPEIKKPRLVRTILGASTDELTANDLNSSDSRVISGSVFHGVAASGEVFGYLGRYHWQITVLREGREREFLGWLTPGANKFSASKTFLSNFLPGRLVFTTARNGSHRAIVPMGLYEKVMPMDLSPTILLRTLFSNHVERAEELGCLELDEEDLALCTFVCPCKNEYGPALRKVLTEIEREG